MKTPRLFNGVRLLPDRTAPCPKNVERLDHSVLPMVARMAKRGLRVDLDHFAKLEVELARDMQRVTEDVRDLTGHYINLGSGDQVADLLFKKMGLKQAKVKFTSSGDRESVENEVLVAIQHEHPVVGKCLEYKEYEKLLGTYVRPMPKLARHTAFTEWRMYPNFTITRIPTGRFATKEPNLLAIPTRTERGNDIRKGFITDDGWTYISVDFSQIEPRVAAHRSLDPNLCRVYREREDIYSDFATAAFRLKDERHKGDKGKWLYPTVDKHEHRVPSKTCVLASIYSVTPPGLQEQMPIVCANCGKPSVCFKCKEKKPHNAPAECVQHDCDHFAPLWTEAKCEGLIQSFYIRYSGLMRMQLDDHAFMRRHALMVDFFGRVQHVQAVRSVLQWVVNGALREGANMPVQGGACGLFKLGLAAVDYDFEVNRLYGDVIHPLLPIHDELVAECREEYADEMIDVIRYRFDNVARLEVPIESSGVKAPSWGLLPK